MERAPLGLRRFQTHPAFVLEQRRRGAGGRLLVARTDLARGLDRAGLLYFGVLVASMVKLTKRRIMPDRLCPCRLA